MAYCDFHNYDWSNGDTCCITGKKVKISKDIFNKYCKYSYNMSQCPIYKKYGPYKSSGCFITTVCCNILGMEDDCALLNNFRGFRDNYLHNDPKYHDILKDYDNIGPKIACSIMQDPESEKIAKGIHDKVLLPINEMINNKEYECACESYYLLTLSLINYYGFKHEYNSDKDNGLYDVGFDVMTSGHGKKLVK